MAITLVLLKGFFASSGLIVAIGAQNAFVIRQGILRQHLFITAFLCSFLDAFLIVIGVLGFGKILDRIPGLVYWAKFFAIAYLIIFGALSLKSALKEKGVSALKPPNAYSLKKTILLLLALTLLNPHAYLDTVILLGSIAAQEEQHLQSFFAIGAISASFSWFFGLTYGSTLFASWLSIKRAIIILDCIVALIMWLIAGALLTSLIPFAKTHVL